MVEVNSSRARIGVMTFLVLVAIASGLIEWSMIRAGGSIDQQPGLVIALMWTPGLACILIRLVRREGFRDVSFRFGGSRGAIALIIAWLFPVVVGAIAYSVAWSTGLARFSPGPGAHMGTGAYLTGFIAPLGHALFSAMPISMAFAMGEELGWRGYLLPRLVQGRIPQPLLISGIVWGLWHLPLILSGLYVIGSNPLLSALMFCVGIIPAAFLFGGLRLYSRSIWPAALAHASWNSVIQDVFDRFTVGTSSWVGEGGILTLMAVALVAVVIVKVLQSSNLPAD